MLVRPVALETHEVKVEFEHDYHTVSRRWSMNGECR